MMFGKNIKNDLLKLNLIRVRLNPGRYPTKQNSIPDANGQWVVKRGEEV